MNGHPCPTAANHARQIPNRKQNNMKFLVLGATDRTGVPFVKKALDQGHEVTALVRRADANVDPRAQIVSGDVTDAAVIATAARGHDAVISTLGANNVRETPTLVTDTVRAVVASAKTSGVDRFVIVSAFGVGDSLAKASLLAGLIFRTALRKTYADKAASELLLKASELKWTLGYLAH
ncbi:NAD(P)-dependent oxidoreductase [Diaminobutyricibacter tongyongensis]|uniref:NAD(P)-dependent oxidoreductase n=1 Tax=Leifsonia tongyongensis TaxID=1268043 RepID=UPI001963F6C3|nr:NAD(P)H-binding protein [Diaminobutyricibacter tongyongensis]